MITVEPIGRKASIKWILQVYLFLQSKCRTISDSFVILLIEPTEIFKVLLSGLKNEPICLNITI